MVKSFLSPGMIRLFKSKREYGLIICFLLVFSSPTLASQSDQSFELVAHWASLGTNQVLKSWKLNELERFKKTTSQEKDPRTGKIVKWEGVLLSQLVDKAMEDLPTESRARVDLVVLKSLTGEMAFIPRALLVKYPLLLAFQSEEEPRERVRPYRGPLYSIVPWSSKSKILNEDLPLETFFVPQVSEIELTSYRDRYRPFFLKRRTDPSAMRGEKLFVQNCVSCHKEGQNTIISTLEDEARLRRFVSHGHVPLKSGVRVTDRDRNSIIRYLDAYRVENSGSISGTIRSAQSIPLSAAQATP